MERIVENLWEGEIQPKASSHAENPQYSEIRREMLKIQNGMRNTLNSEQQTQLDALGDVFSAQLFLSERGPSRLVSVWGCNSPSTDYPKRILKLDTYTFKTRLGTWRCYFVFKEE